MDPLGFSLENFDPIGKWRTESDGAPIDASAVFPDGSRFSGFSGLQALLSQHRDQFVETFIQKMLVYALGREVESYDMPAIRKIKHEAAADNYRWSSIISDIAQSVPFQMSVVRSSQ
jgi:hypothetical protein